MKISPVSLFSFKKTANCNTNFAKYRYNLNCDTFSFSGKNYDLRKDVLEYISDDGNIFSRAGLKGTVYKMGKDGKEYAIKVSRFKDNSFEKEAEVLKRLPSGMSGQKYIDYFQHPKTGCDILITTFVQGSKGVLNGPKDFENFLGTVLKLDEAEVLHGDLNMQNCLFHNEEINLIDFGEGEIYKTGDSYEDFIYPEFVLKSNIINLEHNGIPDCIKSWSRNNMDVYQNFKDYLKAKSGFFDKHVMILKSNGINSKDAIAYEKNLSRVLKNPSDAIIENEIKRIDCLHTFEYADTAVNYENNIVASKRNWNLTVKKAQLQLGFIERNLQNPNLSDDEREYFTYQKKILQTFNEQFSSWSLSTFEWLDSLSKRDDRSNIEQRFIENREKAPSAPPPNIEEMVMQDKI